MSSMTGIVSAAMVQRRREMAGRVLGPPVVPSMLSTARAMVIAAACSGGAEAPLMSDATVRVLRNLYCKNEVLETLQREMPGVNCERLRSMSFSMVDDDVTLRVPMCDGAERIVWLPQIMSPAAKQPPRDIMDIAWADSDCRGEDDAVVWTTTRYTRNPASGKIVVRQPQEYFLVGKSVTLAHFLCAYFAHVLGVCGTAVQYALQFQSGGLLLGLAACEGHHIIFGRKLRSDCRSSLMQQSMGETPKFLSVD